MINETCFLKYKYQRHYLGEYQRIQLLQLCGTKVLKLQYYPDILSLFFSAFQENLKDFTQDFSRIRHSLVAHPFELGIYLLLSNHFSLL